MCIYKCICPSQDQLQLSESSQHQQLLLSVSSNSKSGKHKLERSWLSPVNHWENELHATKRTSQHAIHHIQPARTIQDTHTSRRACKAAMFVTYILVTWGEGPVYNIGHTTHCGLCKCYCSCRQPHLVFCSTSVSQLG